MIDVPAVQAPSQTVKYDTSDSDPEPEPDFEGDEGEHVLSGVNLVKDIPQVTSEPPENKPSVRTAIVSGDALKEKWPDFLEFLIKDRPNLGSFLSFASIGSVSRDSIELKFSSTYRFQYLEVTRKNNKGEISKLLSEFTGGQFEINFVIDTTAASTEEENYIKQIGDIPTTINDQIEKEPIIQTILDIFDGEILN